MASTTLPGLLLTGNHAGRPAATAVGTGTLYACSTHSLVYQSDGASWATWLTATGTGFANPMTTAEDIIYGGASGAPTRKAKGSDGTFLGVAAGALGYAAVTDALLSTSDITTNNASTSKHGFLKKLSNVSTEYMDGTGAWSTPAGGGGGLTPSYARVFRNSNVAVGNGAVLPWNTEDADTDSYHDNSTNPSRLTIPANGAYRVEAQVRVTENSGASTWHLYKNGARIRIGPPVTLSASQFWWAVSFGIIPSLVATDYLELVNGSAGTRNIDTDSIGENSWMSIERVA